MFYQISNQIKHNPSYVNYYFDFGSHKLNTLNKLTSTQIPTTTHTVNNTQAVVTAYDFDLGKQNRVIQLQDVEFNSISFNLNLNQISANNNDEYEFKTNLFTLNTLDELTTNRIFLFGLNLILSKRSNKIKYEFEIYTSKQSTKSDLVSLANENLVNLTFTFNSIELRLDNNEDYLIRLTDKYFNLFFRSLLKAYSSFQLNITSLETPSAFALKSTHLVNSCLSNFKLGTRKSNEKSNDLSSDLKYQFSYYKLIDQTKSISLHFSEINDLEFESTCDIGKEIQKSGNVNLNSISLDSNRDNCYLVTKIDSLTNQKITDFYDCECGISDNRCSFDFWKMGNTTFRKAFTDDIKESRGCIDSNEYACFNNGSCLDIYFLAATNKHNQKFQCSCLGSYVGNR